MALQPRSQRLLQARAMMSRSFWFFRSLPCSLGVGDCWILYHAPLSSSTFQLVGIVRLGSSARHKPLTNDNVMSKRSLTPNDRTRHPYFVHPKPFTLHPPKVLITRSTISQEAQLAIILQNTTLFWTKKVPSLGILKTQCITPLVQKRRPVSYAMAMGWHHFSPFSLMPTVLSCLGINSPPSCFSSPFPCPSPSFASPCAPCISSFVSRSSRT